MSVRKVLLVSNRVMHYRVSVYNYLSRQFHKHGWQLMVRANELQKQNRRIRVQGWLVGVMLLAGVGVTIRRWRLG